MAVSGQSGAEHAGSISIVVRTKDRPVFLRRALDDVAAQTLVAQRPEAVRVVIVNDGGDPAVVQEVVGRHPISRLVTVIDNASSRGRWAAANQGVAAADGDYLVLHDDDDTWQPGFLAETSAFLDAPEHAAYAGVATFTDEVRERAEGESYRELSREPFLREITHIAFIELCRQNLFPPIAYLYRRSVHDVVGPYDESMTVLADWEFNLRTARRFDIGMVTRSLANWHKRVEAGDAADAASRNATAGGDWDYDEAAVRLVNRLLREDLDGERFGVGYLVNTLRLQHREDVERDGNVHLHLEHAIGQMRAAVGGVDRHVTTNAGRVLSMRSFARRVWRRTLGRRSGNAH